MAKKAKKVPTRRRGAVRDRYFRLLCPLELRERMGAHPETNWSEVARQAFVAALEVLEGKVRIG